MTDLMTIGTVITSIKTASDIAKLIKDSGTTLEKAEIKLKIADLIGNLADARIEMASIQELLLEKDTLIKELNDKLNLKNKMVWESPYYFIENGDQKDGPYCQNCFDSAQQLIRLQKDKFTEGLWACTNCSESYKDSNYVRPSPMILGRF
jgi:hypothetical protein